VNLIESSIVAAGAAGLAVGGYFYAGIWPASQIFGRTLRAGRDPREMALTFDDGPNDRCTLPLLDILAKHDVRATFFMVGQYVRQRPDIARAVRDAGHLVGNHTVTHAMLMRCSAAQVREEIAGCNAILEDTLGQPVRYFRPPFGARRPFVLRYARSLGLTPVMWNVTGYDWNPRPAEEVAGILTAGIRRNQKRQRASNLLLHDGGHLAMGADRSHTLRAVEMLLAQGREGREFVTVDRWNER
jgi:peptidoglycan/xylan/chitin deacetylase (PgdA/CDA1 family)